jgi:cytochrome d ubiquinol oxidase subunit I
MTIREQREAPPRRGARAFEAHSENLGFAFLLKRYVDDPRDATPEQIKMAADDTIPASRRCSGPSASWSRSASPSSR